MPKNTTILLIRHGEKPKKNTDPGLAVAGLERAQAYSIYFQNYPNSKTPLKFKYLFASTDSAKSDRPRLTIAPFSQAVNLPINTNFSNAQYQELANSILLPLTPGQYDNCNILICWHHGEVLKLASSLGVDASKAGTWPTKWPGDVFGWLLQITFDANGSINYKQTFCINEKLMHDDHGQDPTDGK